MYVWGKTSQQQIQNEQDPFPPLQSTLLPSSQNPTKNNMVEILALIVCFPFLTLFPRNEKLNNLDSVSKMKTFHSTLPSLTHTHAHTRHTRPTYPTYSPHSSSHVPTFSLTSQTAITACASVFQVRYHTRYQPNHYNKGGTTKGSIVPKIAKADRLSVAIFSILTRVDAGRLGIVKSSLWRAVKSASQICL